MSYSCVFKRLTVRPIWQLFLDSGAQALTRITMNYIQDYACCL